MEYQPNLSETYAWSEVQPYPNNLIVGNDREFRQAKGEKT